MKINRNTEYIDHVIREGDKVRVKTIEQLKDEYAATVDERNVYVYFNTVREDPDGMMRHKYIKFVTSVFDPDNARSFANAKEMIVHKIADGISNDGNVLVGEIIPAIYNNHCYKAWLPIEALEKIM